MKLMVFDVGGTEIKYGVMDQDCNITDKGYVPTPMDSFEHFSQVIYDLYEPHKDEVKGIAMALPGFIDADKGLVLGSGALHYNWGKAVGPLLSEKCGCPVSIENDGKAAAWAEYLKGSLQGCTNAAVFLIGTGVGGGIIINGEVVRGVHATAGEFSYINRDPNLFGQYEGFVGSCCATRGLLGTYKKLKQTDEAIDGREFFRRLPDDPIAQEVLDDFALKIARQCFNLYWLLDTEKIAIGGGVSRQPILIDTIRKKFNEMLQVCAFRNVLTPIHMDIVRSTYGNEANMIGAYMAYTRKYQ